MKAFLSSLAAALLAAGCASTDEYSTASSPRVGETISDQPQSSVAGEGSLMTGAYDTRRMQTGQFTGRERTNDQVGQRPTLPGGADPRELARSEDSTGTTGAGTLGQSGILPDEPVSPETLMETTTGNVAAPAHVAVTPPGTDAAQERTEAGAIGAAPGIESERVSSTNAPAPPSIAP